MSKIIILSGIPGAGKSTLVQQFVATYGTEAVLSPDIIREELKAYDYDEDGNITGVSQKKNKQVFKLYYERMQEKCMNHENIILDATHCTNSSLDTVRDLAAEFGYKTEDIELHRVIVPLSVALERNKHRGYKNVPDFVVRRMYNNLQNFIDEDWYTLFIHNT